MRTYQILRPTATHWRAATCAEVDCPNYLNGWRTVVGEASDLGRRQAEYIRERSGRRFAETREVPDAVTFTFEAGQPCFAGHRLPVGRPELYVVRDGDWRGNPSGTRPRVHTRAEDWVEDMSETLDAVRARVERG